jgi:DNA-binding helix-hairpin-helix protein with protein kinase domain
MAFWKADQLLGFATIMAGVGPARCTVLRSWGVDTAADIQAEVVLAIPGFGALMTDRLVTWRDHVSAGFVANQAPVVDPLEAQRVERSIAAKRGRLVKRLRDQIDQVERRVLG